MTLVPGERRWIEEALHDGVQQDLVAASVALQLALQLLDTDPAAARQLLEELEQQMRDSLERVRELAHEIYPSLLAARGLGEALRAAGIDAALADRYPLEVEEAVYFACRELNGATTRVWDEDGAVCFEAAGRFDDSAIERARAHVAAVGGQLTASAGGVTATVPVSSSAR